MEIRNFLNHYNIDILLLNETLLKNKFKVPGYRVYRNDNNGTALIIKNGIKNYEIQINNLYSLETTAVNIKANGEALSIISVYNSPSNKFNKLIWIKFLIPPQRYLRPVILTPKTAHGVVG